MSTITKPRRSLSWSVNRSLEFLLEKYPRGHARTYKGDGVWSLMFGPRYYGQAKTQDECVLAWSTFRDGVIMQTTDLEFSIKLSRDRVNRRPSPSVLRVIRSGLIIGKLEAPVWLWGWDGSMDQFGPASNLHHQSQGVSLSRESVDSVNGILNLYWGVYRCPSATT